MAGLFDTTNDPAAAVMQRRQQANQALGSPYGKYAGIVQAGGMFADTGADAIAGGGYGSADPTMAKSIELKKIAAVVAQQFPGKTDTPDYYKALALAVQDKYPEKAKEAMDIAAKKEQEAQKAKLTDLQTQQAELGIKKTQTELTAAEQVATKEKEFLEAIKALGPNPTDEQFHNTALKYGDPKTIIADMTRRDAAEARKQVAKEAAEAKKELALEVERQRSANRLEVERLRQEGNKDKLTMQKLWKMTNMPKDVAESISGNSLLLAQTTDLETFIPMLEGVKDENGKIVKNPTVNFSPMAKAKSWASSVAGYPDNNALQLATIRKTMSRMVNTILQAAKGVQTEGDAQRAEKIIKDVNEANSNAGMSNAIKDAIKFQKEVMNRNSVYIQARGYSDVVKTSLQGDALVDHYLNLNKQGAK